MDPFTLARSSAALYRAEGSRSALILAHGAGTTQAHPSMVKIATAIASHGIDVITFNFRYTEEGRKIPDRNDVLEATWMAAIDGVRAHADLRAKRLYVGGRSMGGRIATQVVAKGAEVAGVVLLGYPLHPPSRPDKLRSEHLPRIRVPMLFVQGERDAFGTPEELAPIVKGLAAGTRLYIVQGGDHSFARPKSSGETIDDTLARVAAEVAQFMVG
jgi:predicted alpha/beta-hydrolase family hydrolase